MLMVIPKHQNSFIKISISIKKASKFRSFFYDYNCENFYETINLMLNCFKINFVLLNYQS